MKPRESELIRRYRKNFDIPREANISEQMILAHWELEKQLTLELLQSKPEDRWDTFDRCYTRLYAELGWLNRFVGQVNMTQPPERYGKWIDLIGPPPKSIYEIGSGTGGFLSYLAQKGFACRGTEITRERGSRLVEESFMSLSWGLSDGVHLDRFEPPETYDIVLSNQVLEHLHPEDLEAHLAGVYFLLKGGGRYVFCTPHRYSGPHDISKIFKLHEPKGMHLREYTYLELVKALNRIGFSRVYYAFIPRKIRMLLVSMGVHGIVQANRFGPPYLRFLLSVEKALSVMPTFWLRRLCIKVLRGFYLFSDSICLVAEKRTAADQVAKLSNVPRRATQSRVL